MASQPPHLENDDWELWSDESRATAIKVWITQRDSLRLKITEVANALPSLCFSDSFKASGVGPVYMAREDPCNDKRVLLYQLSPPELSYVIENDPYSQSHFDALPNLTQEHLQTLFPDPAEAAAVLRIRRLSEILVNMGYVAWGMPFSASSGHMYDTTAVQPVLSEISKLEQQILILTLPVLLLVLTHL